MAVPDVFYKIIIREDGDSDFPIVMAFIYPHAIQQSDNKKVSNAKGYPHEKFLVSVEEIQRLTGLNFFTIFSEDEQKEIEIETATEVWEDPGEFDLLK